MMNQSNTGLTEAQLRELAEIEEQYRDDPNMQVVFKALMQMAGRLQDLEDKRIVRLTNNAKRLFLAVEKFKTRVERNDQED